MNNSERFFKTLCPAVTSYIAQHYHRWRCGKEHAALWIEEVTSQSQQRTAVLLCKYWREVLLSNTSDLRSDNSSFLPHMGKDQISADSHCLCVSDTETVCSFHMLQYWRLCHVSSKRLFCCSITWTGTVKRSRNHLEQTEEQSHVW